MSLEPRGYDGVPEMTARVVRAAFPKGTLASWLPGYEGSAPVRIGNAAVDQRQLDGYGEVVDALHLSLTAGLPASRQTWSLQRSLLDVLEKHWGDPDNGLWKVRGPQRHFVHIQTALNIEDHASNHRRSRHGSGQ